MTSSWRRRTSACALGLTLLSLSTGCVLGGDGHDREDGPPPSWPQAAPGTADPDELLVNTSFDQGADGWEPVGGAVPVAVDKGRALRLGESSAPWAGIAQRVESGPWRPGEQLTARVWLRAEQAGRKLRLELTEEPAGPGRRAADVEQTFVSVDTEWRPFTLTIVPRRAGSAVRLQVLGQRLDAVPVDVDAASLRVDRRPAVPVGRGHGTLTNGCAVSPRGVPVCGALVGGAYGLNDDVGPWEAQLPRPIGVRRTYFQADQVDYAVRTAQEDVAAGRLPWLSFKLPYSWREMSEGRGDAWAHDLATRLAALDGPVWVAFHHEPENDGVLTEWTRTQRRLAPLVRSAAPNVGFTVILTGYNQVFGPPDQRLDRLVPRGVRVDVIGFDTYNSDGVVLADGRELEPSDLTTELLDPLSRWAARHRVAWAIAETGYTKEASEHDPRWLRRTYQDLLARGGVALVYFNSAANSTVDFRLDTARKLADFRRISALAPRLR